MTSDRISLRSVYAVPPLARTNDPSRAIDFEQNDRIVSHIIAGGIDRLIYGGNAFLYHVTLREYEQVLEWQSDLQRRGVWVIIGAGPSFGRLMDQAPVLRRYGVSCAMVLPCGDPRDVKGITRGLREFSDASGARILAYVKDEANLGSDREQGLESLGELINEGTCIGIKYAVVQPEPESDAYLEALLKHVDHNRVISGIGERPAVTHLRHWKLAGFTTGSGCLAPVQSAGLLAACDRGDYTAAEELRRRFLDMEDMRDLWGPARVLHHAVELAGIACSGAIPPFVSPLTDLQQLVMRPVVQQLIAQEPTRTGVVRRPGVHAMDAAVGTPADATESL